MKRFLVSLVIMVIICLVAVWGFIYTDRCCETVIRNLDSAKRCLEIGDFSEARQFCKRAKGYFEGKEGVLAVFLNHDLVEEIQISLGTLAEYADESSTAVFWAKFEEAKIQLEQLKESQLHIP